MQLVGNIFYRIISYMLLMHLKLGSANKPLCIDFGYNLREDKCLLHEKKCFKIKRGLSQNMHTRGQGQTKELEKLFMKTYKRKQHKTDKQKGAIFRGLFGV